MSTKSKPVKNFVNHVALVVDGSVSMDHLESTVIKIVDDQVKSLGAQSKTMDQETRLSVFIFGTGVENLVWEMDVLRMPSIAGSYQACQGSTALIDGTIRTVTDLKKIPEMYGDHAFLVFVITDGQNNVNNQKYTELNTLLTTLPENYTVAVLVPDQTGVHHAKQFGFPAQNISVWRTDKQGLEEASQEISRATANYMTQRAKGVRGTKNLFNMKPVDINTIKTKLEPVAPGTFETLLVRQYDNGKAIKDFVESWRKQPYVVGSAYYQITKPEKIQPTKVLAVKEVRTGKLYSGLAAREILGLPDHEVKVSPPDSKEILVFAQSTSVNRKLVADTQLIVMV